MKQKYFWNKKWFWISLTSLATVGLATFSTITNSSQALTVNNLTKSMFADSTSSTPDVNTLSGYGYHAVRSVTYVPWTDDSSKKIIDVFPTVAIANQVLNALRVSISGTFTSASTISSSVSKTNLQSVTSLDLSNLNLNNVDEIFNPAITWNNLISINLSNNNFGDYVLKFNKTQMPKLYSITARNANLQEMVDVSSYVEDPFDQATTGSDERTKAEAQYTKAATSGVPRYFDLFQNQIRQVPKYYLKISLASLDLGSNKLGTGTPADPQGVYAIPWYSMKTTTNTNTIGIADPNIRGPYGINLYNTGAKSGDSYTYSDEEVARWRAQPYPIKGLRFAKYNVTPNAAGTLDSGITFPGSDDNPATGSGSDPFFNFSNNSLVNIPIFSQANVSYANTSLISPQSKAATVFVGLNDFKTSKIYMDAASKPEMYTPQPDMIYPIISNWSWNGAAQSNQTWFAQGMQGLYYPRSFNGINQFVITKDSRASNSAWNNGTSGLTSVSGGGVSWSLPTLPTNNWASLLTSNPAFFGSSSGQLTFTNASDNNYYQKWAALRTFPLSAKTFAKKNYLETWNGQSDVDSNLYYDNAAWTGATTSDTTTPNNRIGQTWFYQTQVGHNPAPRLATGSANQFLGAPSSVISSYILGISKAAYFSNINTASDYGTPTSTTTPFTQGLAITAPRYNYRTNYQVVDSIKSSLNETSNFPTTLEADGFDLSKYKNGSQPVFARNITANDIKNGEGVFWKSNNQFDQAYMKTLDPTKIKMDWDDATGTLKYSFPVYSPGYSTLGRLFQKGDSVATATNNATPTIDFEVNNTISGFAKTNLKMKGPTGDSFSDVNPNLATNNVLTQVGPTAFLDWVKTNPISSTTDATVLSNLQTEIAKNFQTTYFGNNSTVQEGTEALLNSSNVNIVNIDNSNGAISFKINIPDHVFGNGNRLVFPQKYKDLTFTWTGLQVPNLTIIGTNLSNTAAPGLSFSAFSLSAYTQFKNKAASQITASDIVSANVITSTRGDWIAIKDETSNLNNYFELSPSDINGTLTWTLKLPGDTSSRNQGLLPLTVVVQWAGFMHQNTSIAWKNQTTLAPLGLGKTPNELLADIKAHPANYLTVVNGRENGGTTPLTTNDFDFTKMETLSVINQQQGTVQVAGIGLKSYYKNGVWVDNSASASAEMAPVYLRVPTITLQAQIPFSVATFASATPTSTAAPAQGNQAIWTSIEPFYHKSLYDDTTETSEALVKKLSTSEIKQLLVNNNVSPLDNVLTLTTSPATSAIVRNNLQFLNNDLKQSIDSDPLKGTLTFKNLSVNNWMQKGSNTPLTSHALAPTTYTFQKLTTSWKWASSIPLEVSSLSFSTILSELNNPTSASALMDHFNVGQKYYDNDGVLKNAYTVTPSLIELDPYLGTLTFKPNAVQVSNWVTDGSVSLTPHSVSEQKVYTFTNKLQTRYEGNVNLTQGVNQYINNWVTVVKNDSYTNASAEQKAKYLAEFGQLKAPNYANVDVDQGIALTNRYLAEKHLKEISASDQAVIASLKNKSGLESVDFDQYFYVPQYLLFWSSPPPNTMGNNRTFTIAESVSSTPFSNTAMQLNNIYIVNYYNFPGKDGTSIQKIPNILFTGFSRAVSTVTFNADETHTGTNKLANEWAALTATQIKERLDYLTANRNNPTITGGAHWQAIQKEWLSTFTPKNIPYNGIQDPTIVYPVNVVASDYQRKLVVNQLLFPYYSQTTTAANPNAIALNQRINVQEAWVAQVGTDSFIQQVANLKDDRFQKIPSTLLKDLGLTTGDQSDGNNTWNKLLTENIYVLNGNLAPIGNPSTNVGTRPSVSVGKISVDDQKGTITFENVTGANVWVDGQQVTSKTFGNLVLDLGLQSTELVKNSNHVIGQWLMTTTNETTISASLISLNQKILSGEFGVTEFNAMLNNFNAFFNVSNPADDPETQVQVIPGTNLSEVFHLNMTNGEVTLKNLQIVKGYLNNVKVASQNVSAPLVFHLGWDYSTNFNQQFQVLLTQKNLLHSNTDHAATVLNQNPQQLLRYLNVQELEGQIETPSVSVSSNAVLGKLTFNVHFKNYYQNGINLGARQFSYTFNEFQQTLPAILGGIGAGLAVILIALIAWYIRNYIKNKDQLMIKTTKKAKHEE